MEKELIVILGPTCSGKSELSFYLAGLLNTEIISADSRQFYKYMDIGTAKPSDYTLKSIKHHMIDFLQPDEEFNVSKFQDDVLNICKLLWKCSQIPIITGGSGLYIKSFIDGLSNTPDPDIELRVTLRKEKDTLGNRHLYDRLKEIDPESAAQIHPNNWKRIIRALEVFYITGKTLSSINQTSPKVNNYHANQYGLLWPREKLYERIDRRCDDMMKAGLVEEVKNILSNGYSKNLNSLNTLGYKEIIAYLEEELSLDIAIELFKRNTRRYAKRQLTWFRKDKRIAWFSVEKNEDLRIFAEKIAGQYKTRIK